MRSQKLPVTVPGKPKTGALLKYGRRPGAKFANDSSGSSVHTHLSALFSLSSLIEQARRFGTSIVDALRTQAEMLRCQREQRAEELAQKAAVKILFPTLLFIFPAIFVVLVGPAAVRLYEIFSANAVRSN